MNAVFKLILAMFNLSRYKLLFFRVIKSLLNLDFKEEIGNDSIASLIKREYRLMSVIFVLFSIIFIYIQRIDVLLVCWVIPLFVAEAVHFLIETPEHYGLDTQTDREVLRNTWTIKTNWFLRWLTNGNNFHTAHHFHTGVPMQNIAKLQEKIDRFCESKSNGYFTFYSDVVTGKIKYQEGKSAMKN